MRTVTVLVLVALFAGAVPESVAAEDVPLGNWTGFAVRLNNNNQNRQPRVLVVKKVPDPHVAWRGGSGELVTIGFGANQNNLNEVNSIALSDGRLTFTFAGEERPVTCVLLFQQKDNNYLGDCIGENREWRVTLNPPPPAAPKPAATKPAEAK